MLALCLKDKKQVKPLILLINSTSVLIPWRMKSVDWKGQKGGCKPPREITQEASISRRVKREIKPGKEVSMQSTSSISVFPGTKILVIGHYGKDETWRFFVVVDISCEDNAQPAISTRNAG